MPTWDEGKLGELLYDQIIEWIKDTYTPSDVFDNNELIKYVRENFEPEDIYDLEDYGYTKE